MIVIQVEDLWKQYRYGTIGYRTLRHDLQSLWARFRGKEDPNGPLAPRGPGSVPKRFWALQGVSFSVAQGDILGIIGRNGAGKSTLLKVMSRVTMPTKGCVKIKGRVASLLEVGTGFHPDLTGRENIFLNGTILGMTKAEIRRNFDEIVAFAGIEPFVDTPVKRYSSGMQVRLAFAVAAHLEAEILLVDEVLAVGDIQFQKKALTKMEDVCASGRTVLFVSHNLNVIDQICTSVLLLDRGGIREMGDTQRVIVNYQGIRETDATCGIWVNDGSDPGNEWFIFDRVFIGDDQGRPAQQPMRNDVQYYLYADVTIHKTHPALSLGYTLSDRGGALLYWSFMTDTPESEWPALEPGKRMLRAELPRNTLNEGFFQLEAVATLRNLHWLYEPNTDVPLVSFAIEGGLSRSPYWVKKRPGLFAPIMRWRRTD